LSAWFFIFSQVFIFLTDPDFSRKNSVSGNMPHKKRYLLTLFASPWCFVGILTGRFSHFTGIFLFLFRQFPKNKIILFRICRSDDENQVKNIYLTNFLQTECCHKRGYTRDEKQSKMT